MKQSIFTVAALTLMTALAPLAAQAQRPASELAPVPTKGSHTSDPGGGSFLIPFDPPILATWGTSKGEAELLGQKFAVTSVSHSFTTLGVDGTPLSVSTLQVFTFPDGSASFVRSNGLFRPSAKAGFIAMEGTWTSTGGRGMFLGASGHGPWSGELELATGKLTASWQGVDVMPNAKKP